MTDEATTEAPAVPDEVAQLLTPEAFDVNDWLAGTQYPSPEIIIYRNGELLNQMQELADTIAQQEARIKDEKRQLLRSIDDEADAESAGIMAGAIAHLDSLRQLLATEGNGATFKIQGLSPTERDLLRDSTARTLKPTAAVYEGEGDTRVTVEPAKGGGMEHPDFPDAFERVLLARCIKSVNGQPVNFTPEDIDGLKKLPGVEFKRLSNATYNSCYLAYQIDQLVDVDFSSRL